MPPRGHRFFDSCRAWLGGAVLWAAAGLAAQAWAQNALGLRGTPTTAQTGLNASATPPAAAPSAAPEPFVPFSAGAVPEGALAADPVFPADLTSAAARLAPATQEASASTAASEPVAANGRAEEEGRAAAGDEVDGFETGRTLRTGPAEAGPLSPVAETEPFGPLGIRLGSFVLLPSLETGIGASTNAANVAGGESGVFAESTLRLDARSDWSRHQLELSAFGTWRETLSGADVDEVEGGAEARALWDLAEGFRARTELTYAVGPESASSPLAIPEAAERPLRHNLGLEAGVERDVGILRLGATGMLERDWFDDAELADGSTLSQAERNSTLAAVTLRAGYGASPALVPFAEVEVGQRFLDESCETCSEDRTATRLAGRVGVAFDGGEKIGGELAIGLLRESFEDDALDDIEGLSLEADLRWSPLRGTDVTLTAETTVEGAVGFGQSGALVQDITLAVAREIRANLTGFSNLGVSVRETAGTDEREWTSFAEAGLTWWLNRQLGLTGRLRHEGLTSDSPDREYEATSAFLGLRLQR